MKLQATSKTGQTYTGNEVKSVLICEEDGTPLIIAKETIIGNLKNYKILTPGDSEFTALTQALGYDIRLVRN